MNGGDLACIPPRQSQMLAARALQDIPPATIEAWLVNGAPERLVKVLLPETRVSGRLPGSKANRQTMAGRWGLAGECRRPQ